MAPASDAPASLIREQTGATERRELRRWVPAIDSGRHPAFRLFCFPYAGTGASAFRDWQAGIGRNIDVLPVQLPGRESRWHEPAFVSMSALARRLTTVMGPALETPYALFGHSMGGLIVFEFACELRRAGLPMPQHIFISSTRAPHVPDREFPLHLLPDAAFLAQLTVRFGLAPDQNSIELAKALLPTLRADFALCENYRPAVHAPLDVPVTVYGGRADRIVVYGDLVNWSAYTKRGFKLQIFPGDHFYLHPRRTDILRALSSELADVAERTETAT